MTVLTVRFFSHRVSIDDPDIRWPDQINNAYYSSIPDPVYWPMFAISTLAAVVASQSMISATFSIIKQSIALDCFPHIHIVHTSSKHKGQIYCHEINYLTEAGASLNRQFTI